MRAHARESFELATTFFRSLSKSQQPLFQRSSFRLHQNGVKLTWICFGRYSIFLGCSISSICPAPLLHLATLPGSKYMFFGTKYCLSTRKKANCLHIAAQRILMHACGFNQVCGFKAIVGNATKGKDGS